MCLKKRALTGAHIADKRKGRYLIIKCLYVRLWRIMGEYNTHKNIF